MKTNEKTIKTRPKKEIEKQPLKKEIKILVNLDRCSQNWKALSQVLPKCPAWKKKVKPVVEIRETSSETQVKLEESTQEVYSNKIWFDVDKNLIPDSDSENIKSDESGKNSTVEKAVKLTKRIAIDCEMVGVSENGQDSIVARVSLVNELGECVYDKYVIPTEKVTDFRTNVSGIRPNDVKKENNAIHLSQVQKEVTEILNGRILVGHAIHNDLKVLFLSHPKKKIRDTQKCKVFRRQSKSIGSLASLKQLAKVLLGTDIQSGEHDSVKDAQVTMRLYTTYRKEWEQDIRLGKSAKSTNDSKIDKIENTSKIINGQFKNDEINIKTGNESHKRYLTNKLSKRSNNFNKKKFFKK